MKTIFTLFFLFFSSFVFSQVTYNKKINEKSDEFIKRIFPQYKFKQIISGNWGDTTNAIKIIGFYSDLNNDSTKAIILQSYNRENYTRLKFDYVFGTGLNVSASNIISFFFYDVNNDRIRELIILESFVSRCYTEIEEEKTNEDGKTSIIQNTISALCEGCSYTVFEQKLKSELVNSILSEAFTDEQNDKCNAESIKSLLKQKK